MSKGSQPAGNVTTTQGPPQYEYPYIGTALNQAGSLLASGGPQYYPGQQVAPFSPLQEQYFTGASQLGNNPTLGAANQFGQNLMSGNFSGPQANLAQMGTGSMNNPELSNLLNLQNQSIQSNIGSQFAGAGRNLEASIPLQAQTMGNADSQLLSNAYNINQGNALGANQALGGLQANAMGQAPWLNNANLSNLQAQGQAGNQLQQQAQNQIGANQNLFNFYQSQPYQQLGQYEQFLGGVTPGMQQSSPYFNNPTANALGTGLGALGLYNGLGQAGLLGSKGASTGAAGTGAGSAMEAALGAMSDRRLKEDIKRVGTTENGLPIYTFRYKGHHQVNMGVMADEVKEKFPEAVIKHPSGYDMVNYGMIR